MLMSHEEMRSKIKKLIAEIDEGVEETRVNIKEQLEIGFMTPELLVSFVELLNVTISMMDERRKLVEYAKSLGMDIR